MLAPTPIEPSFESFEVNSPVQPAILDNGRARCHKKLIRIPGRRQLQSIFNHFDDESYRIRWNNAK